MEIRIQFKAPVSVPGSSSSVSLDNMRNELVMRLQPSEVLATLVDCFMLDSLHVLLPAHHPASLLLLLLVVTMCLT